LNGLLYCSGTKESGDVVIPDGVKSICGKAFEECSGITNVSIPDSVAYIGWGAFRNCTGLESLTVPQIIMRIGAIQR